MPNTHTAAQIKNTTHTTDGVLYGVGVGTGDPELLTLKALRIIREAPAVCYLVNHQGYSQARQIAQLAFTSGNPQQQEIPITMPMALDRKAAGRAYDQAADRISRHLAAGQDVAFLCEGDPLFFGSFAYLLERLQAQVTCRIVPGISTIHTASAALTTPLTRLSDSLAVISGRHDEDKIRHTLAEYDSVVIMKVAGHRKRLRRLLEESGRLDEAYYMEYLGREQERIVQDFTTLPDDESVYFSVVVVTRPPQNGQAC